MYDIGEEGGIDDLHAPLQSLVVLLPHSPLAHEVSCLPTEETSVGDAGDTNHVLHQFTFHVSVVGEGDGLCVCVWGGMEYIKYPLRDCNFLGESNFYRERDD